MWEGKMGNVPEAGMSEKSSLGMRLIRWTGGSLIALAVASAAQAQTIGLVTERGRTRLDPAAVEAQARSLHDQPQNYRRAAELYLQASDLRAPGDPRHVTNRKMAASILFYSGNTARARVVMEEAANAALAAGDIVQAAHIYLDASILARNDGAPGDANRLASKAELLMKSPLVSDVDRRAVLARFNRG
jgi:hypothetical protein